MGTHTHIGDARATDMKRAGMINIGELARNEYGEDNVFLVGFGSYRGNVIAGDAWGAPMEVMEVPPARDNSIENALHEKCNENCYFIFDEETDKLFDQRINHRAIGVVYHPERERPGNYVPTVMSRRYNAFIFLNETKALHALHLPYGKEIPETYPFGV